MSVVELSLKKSPRYKLYLEGFLLSFIGCLIVNVLFCFLPTFWANLLVGKNGLEFVVTFQDVMWVIFFIGLIQLKERNREIKIMQSYELNQYLPEDFETIIDDPVLTKIIKDSKLDAEKNMGILPYMILQISLQFRTNNSISLISDFLSKQLELFLHKIELRYNTLKYIIWVIPSIGFMGTVYGIGLAVSKLGEGSLDDPNLLTQMAGSLGIAFNTTLLALVLSVVLQFFTQFFEAKEENIINDFGKYIMDNLINKIVEKR